MGVYIKCPQCGEELNHDDEAYHLSKEGGDSNVLSCRKCEWVGVVKLGFKYETLSELKGKLEERIENDKRAIFRY